MEKSAMKMYAFYRSYRRFRSILESDRKHILTYLGIKDGLMRPRAEKENPECVVCYKLDYYPPTPIGWAAYFKRNDQVHVYVQPRYRRQGFGRELIRRLLEGREVRPRVSFLTAESEAFFRSILRFDGDVPERAKRRTKCRVYAVRARQALQAPLSRPDPLAATLIPPDKKNEGYGPTDAAKAYV